MPTTAVESPACASANAPTRTKDTVLTPSCSSRSSASPAAWPNGAARRRVGPARRRRATTRRRAACPQRAGVERGGDEPSRQQQPGLRREPVPEFPAPVVLKRVEQQAEPSTTTPKPSAAPSTAAASRAGAATARGSGPRARTRCRTRSRTPPRPGRPASTVAAPACAVAIRQPSSATAPCATSPNMKPNISGATTASSMLGSASRVPARPSAGRTPRTAAPSAGCAAPRRHGAVRRRRRSAAGSAVCGRPAPRAGVRHRGGAPAGDPGEMLGHGQLRHVRDQPGRQRQLAQCGGKPWCSLARRVRACRGLARIERGAARAGGRDRSRLLRQAGGQLDERALRAASAGRASAMSSAAHGKQERRAPTA